MQDEHALFRTAPVQHNQPAQKIKKVVPPYGQRHGFVPRATEDFGDGGAFPEVHVAQYPLDMGKKKVFIMLFTNFLNLSIFLFPTSLFYIMQTPHTVTDYWLGNCRECCCSLVRCLWSCKG